MLWCDICRARNWQVNFNIMCIQTQKDLKQYYVTIGIWKYISTQYLTHYNINNVDINNMQECQIMDDINIMSLCERKRLKVIACHIVTKRYWLQWNVTLGNEDFHSNIMFSIMRFILWLNSSLYGILKF